MNSTDSQFGGGDSETGYDMGKTQIYSQPTSRLEDLLAVPTCMEYYRWPEKNSDGKYETLLVGDSIGIITVYNFNKDGWHSCTYRMTAADLQESKKDLSSNKPNTMDVLTCHKKEIKEAFFAHVE